MKILIIEDELPAAKRLSKMLESIDSGITVLDVCDSVESSVKWLNNNPAPELILMDIELADGRSFEIFGQLTITSPVIFITSYDEFAIKAIKLNALDYLLKPIDKNELAEAIQKAKTTAKNPGHIDYSDLQQATLNEAKQKKLAISDINGVRFVDIDKIIRLKADSNYTHIFLTGGETIISSRTLKEYEDLLCNSGFFRVHNTYIINLKYVEKYVKGIGGAVIMSDGVTIDVARQKKKELLAAISLNH